MRGSAWAHAILPPPLCPSCVYRIDYPRYSTCSHCDNDRVVCRHNDHTGDRTTRAHAKFFVERWNYPSLAWRVRCDIVSI